MILIEIPRLRIDFFISTFKFRILPTSIAVLSYGIEIKKHFIYFYFVIDYGDTFDNIKDMNNKKDKFIERLHNKELFLHIIPDNLLYTKTNPVTNFDKDLKNIISDMREFMIEYSGVGLAGNQIGIMQNIITIMPNDNDFMALINPQIIFLSKETCDIEEGCLSIPDTYYSVNRPESIIVSYQDEYGKDKTSNFDGIKARIILHEIDHLNGIVFIDHLSRLKKQIVEKKFKKLSKKL